MSSWIYLSYALSPETPAYANGKTMEIERLKEIQKGDSCNTSFWKLPDHIGTHIDFPRHFNRQGNSMDSYGAKFWIFNNVFLIDLAGHELPAIIDNSSIGINDISRETELLMIKTGYGKVRSEEAYWRDSPIFMPELADEMRKRCPQLRTVGIDTISISSMRSRELGRETHREFLCSDKPILIIEDMDLCKIGKETSFKKVIVVPLRVSGADGSPCTILGELK